ncbi:MAG: AAA family ATPase [Desulfurococcales archaeon]|nr:AAA family ATPase [Desulfurococcales archaeon]
MSIIIRRPELENFLRTNGRRLLYGRRKTGKTFTARQTLPNYNYYIVRKGGTIYNPEDDIELDTSSFTRLCRVEEHIILDEFHRANPKLFDAIHAGTCTDQLVLITSTLHYYKKHVTGKDAPLQGLFKQYKVDLISPKDLLSHKWKKLDKETIELLVYYQEPILIGWTLHDIAISGPEMVKGLVGDILMEEDLTITNRYLGILEAIAAGKTRLTEITNWLYSKGLIKKPETGMITKYLAIMTKIGLLEKIPIWRTKRGIYRHKSPLTYTLYYLEARYSISDTPLPPQFKTSVIKQIVPHLIETFIEKLFMETLGLRPVKILQPETDIALTKFKQLKLIAEVKWTSDITRQKLREIEEKLAKLPAETKLLILPDKTILPRETWLQVLDITDLVKMAKGELIISKNS